VVGVTAGANGTAFDPTQGRSQLPGSCMRRYVHHSNEIGVETTPILFSDGFRVRSASASRIDFAHHGKRGVSTNSQTIARASGTHRTYLRTTDGEHWTAAKVPGAESLDFTASLLSQPTNLPRLHKCQPGGTPEVPGV
jgi:hypothetical protein